MTDCFKCTLVTSKLQEDKPKHGRPPRDLQDTKVPIGVFGDLETATICKPDYNKLLTSNVYKVVTLTSHPYPIETTEALYTEGAIERYAKVGMPHDQMVTSGIMHTIRVEDTVRYLGLSTADSYIVTPKLTAVRVIDSVKHVPYSVTGDGATVAGNITSVKLLFGAAYPSHSFGDSMQNLPLIQGVKVL